MKKRVLFFASDNNGDKFLVEKAVDFAKCIYTSLKFNLTHRFSRAMWNWIAKFHFIKTFGVLDLTFIKKVSNQKIWRKCLI